MMKRLIVFFHATIAISTLASCSLANNGYPASIPPSSTAFFTLELPSPTVEIPLQEFEPPTSSTLPFPGIHNLKIAWAETQSDPKSTAIWVYMPSMAKPEEVYRSDGLIDVASQNNLEWSRNGERIAFSKWYEPGLEIIAIVDVSSRSIIELDPNEHNILELQTMGINVGMYHTAWSINDGWIWFETTRFVDMGVIIRHYITDTQFNTVMELDERIEFLEWTSKDPEKFLAFQYRGMEPTELVSYELDGFLPDFSYSFPPEFDIPSSFGVPYIVQISPDGSSILGVDWGNNLSRAYRMDLSTGEVEVLAEIPFALFGPISNNGEWIPMYESSRICFWHIGQELTQDSIGELDCIRRGIVLSWHDEFALIQQPTRLILVNPDNLDIIIELYDFAHLSIPNWPAIWIESD